MASYVCLIYEDETVNQVMFMKANFVRLSRCRPNSYERILNMVVLRRYIFLMNMVFLHLLFLFFWPIFGYEDEYYFPVYFFNEYVKPMFGELVVYLLRLFFYGSIYSYIGSAGLQIHFFLYLFTQMEFQLMIVEDNVRNIGNMVSKNGTIRQSEVNENLRVCVRHYLIVKE